MQIPNNLMKNTYNNFKKIVYLSTSLMKEFQLGKLVLDLGFRVRKLLFHRGCTVGKSRGYSSGFIISFKYSKTILRSYLDIWDFALLSIFRNKISDVKLFMDNVYTVYVKIRYTRDNFLMVGNQFGFTFDSEQSYEVLFHYITARLKEYFTYYKLINEDIVYALISFRLLDKMIFSNLFLDKDKLAHRTPREKKDAIDLI